MCPHLHATLWEADMLSDFIATFSQTSFLCVTALWTEVFSFSPLIYWLVLAHPLTRAEKCRQHTRATRNKGIPVEFSISVEQSINNTRLRLTLWYESVLWFTAAVPLITILYILMHLKLLCNYTATIFINLYNQSDQSDSLLIKYLWKSGTCLQYENLLLFSSSA